jgi:hypothetical protein
MEVRGLRKRAAMKTKQHFKVSSTVLFVFKRITGTKILNGEKL